MKSILIVTISHKAKDVRLYHKIAKTLAQKYKVIILHNNQQEVCAEENIDLIALDNQVRKVFLATAMSYIVSLKPDVVVVVEPILLVLAKVFTKLKFVYDCHEFFGLAQREKSSSKLKQMMNEKLHHKLESQTIPLLHACITVNDILTNKFTEYGVNSYTIPNYPMLSEVAYSNNKVYDFVYVGGLSPERGISEIIQAIKVLVVTHPSVKVLIIGKELISGYYDELQAKIKSLNLEDNIILKQEIPHTQVEGYLAQSKCGLCLLSPKVTRYKYALPIKLLEYLNAGLLVITNNFPFNKKIYNSSEGIFTSEFNASAIATEMCKSISLSEEKRLSHANVVKKIVKEKYSWNMLEAKLMAIFDKITSSQKKGLMIAYFFPPLGGAGVQRPLKFTKYAKELNWDFDVLTVKDIMFHSYDDSFLKEIDNTIIRAESLDLMSLAQKIKLLTSKEKNSPDSTYFKTSEFKKKLIKSLFFMDDKIGWVIPAIMKGMTNFLKNDYNVVIVSIYPVSSLLIGWILARLFNKPFIIDYRDHWTLSSYFDFTNDFSRQQYKRLEKFFLDQASGVLTIGQVMKQELIDEFNINSEKIQVMYNGYDKEDFVQGLQKVNKKITISYVGNMYKHRTSKYFLEAVKQLIDEGKINSHEIAIEYMGNYYVEELSVIENSGLVSIINITSQQEHELAIKKMQDSDILLLLIGTKSGKNVLTGKVFEYLKCNKAILGLVPNGGEAEQLLNSLGNPWTCQAEDVESIKKQLLAIIDFVKARKSVEWNIEDFSRFEQTKKAITFIEKCL